ncbi:MAG: hypothetical protein HUU56_04150 [Bdellovibrionaceae bacterium]|nr:hypothetical protein [Pseudobdellovibrionaceae bacterium]
MMSKLRYVLLLTTTMVISLNSNAKNTCITKDDFQPQWDNDNKSCLLKLTTDAADDYDLLFDFNNQEFRIARKNLNKTSIKDPAYIEVSFIKLQALDISKAKSLKNLNYTVLKQNWKNGTSNVVSKDQPVPNTIISSHGALSFSRDKPTNLKKDTVITLATQNEISTSDCTEPNQNFLVINKENKAKKLIAFNFKYTENFSQLKSEQDCLAVNSTKDIKQIPQDSKPLQAK